MHRDQTRIWYDLTMSLTYPSVLGAIIYFFFDASIQIYVIPLLENMFCLINPRYVVTTSVPYSFFRAFGLKNDIGFLAFLFITLLTMLHFSADYLYSKYSEDHYNFFNFLCDTTISLFLAVAYIILSKGAAQGFHQIKLAFTVFWLCLALTYLFFLWWDARAYLELRNDQKTYAQFYLGMIRWFEISGVIVFLVFALLPFLATEANRFTYMYVIISILVLGVFSGWFCLKVYALEKLSRTKTSAKSSDAKKNPTSEELTVKQMQVADIKSCTEIFVDAYNEVYSEPWTEETGNDRLLELYQYAPDYCFTLRLGGIVVGFIIARPFSWHDGIRVWIEEVVVKEQHRDKGFGKLLIQTLLQKCQSRDVVGISLLSEKSSLAFKIYEKLGFTPSNWMHLEADLEILLPTHQQLPD